MYHLTTWLAESRDCRAVLWRDSDSEGVCAPVRVARELGEGGVGHLLELNCTSCQMDAAVKVQDWSRHAYDPTEVQLLQDHACVSHGSITKGWKNSVQKSEALAMCSSIAGVSPRTCLLTHQSFC